MDEDIRMGLVIPGVILIGETQKSCNELHIFKMKRFIIIITIIIRLALNEIAKVYNVFTMESTASLIKVYYKNYEIK